MTYVFHSSGIKNVLLPIKMLHRFFPSSRDLAHALVFEEVMQSTRPGLDLILDGGILSTARAFTITELYAAFDRAGYNKTAISCTTSEDIPLAPCRLACIVRFDNA